VTCLSVRVRSCTETSDANLIQQRQRNISRPYGDDNVARSFVGSEHVTLNSLWWQ